MAVAKKAPAKKTAAKKKADPTQDLVYHHDMTVHYIEPSKLKQWPKNPNTGGSEEALADSIEENKQYRPIIVQKSTMYIVAGNHTFEQLVEMGVKVVACHLFELTDDEAIRMVIADNRIPSLANISAQVEAELLAELGDWRGTGFSEEDFDLITKASQEALADLDEMLSEQQSPLQQMQEILGENVDDDTEWGEDDNSIGGEDEVDRNFDAVDETINAVFQLGEEVKFPGATYWGIPVYREDMLIDTLPEPLMTWAGSATRDHPDADKVWWLYNYGTDSTSGMRDLSKMVLSFYSYDEYFENWWHNPTKYVGRAINSKVKYAITPDFTMAGQDEGMATSIYQLYRNHWLGRYMQEAGIKIMPNVNWPHNEIDFMVKYVLPCEPVGAPLISFGLVAFDSSQSAASLKLQAECYRTAIEILKPERVFLYTAKTGREWWETLKIKTPVVWQNARMDALSAQAKKREKKTTL